MVSLPPPVRRSACAWSCDAAIPRASTRCTERRRSGSRSTGTPWMRFAMPRRRRTGRTRPACSPRLDRAGASTAARRPSHALLAAFPAEVPCGECRAGARCSRRTACSTARSRRPPHTSPLAETAAGAVPPERRWHLDLSGPACSLSLARRQGDLERRHGGDAVARGGLEGTARERRRVQQRPPGDGADEPRHRRALVDSASRGARAPRGGAHACAKNRAALPGGRLPRPPGNGRFAHWMPASVALQRSEEAVAIAETHGWADRPGRLRRPSP